MLKIGFIGSGNMASALIRSMKGKGVSIIASDSNKIKLSRIRKLGVKTTLDNKEAAKNSDIIFLCTKPNDISSVLRELKGHLRGKVIVSIAAGIKISSIEKIAGKGIGIMRVMPNLNCTVGEMAAAYSPNKNVKNKDKKIIHNLLNSAGIAIEVNEGQMDAVTALSGSGPAFAAYIIEAFADAGSRQGLPREISYKLALQTFYGTSVLLRETKEDPKELVRRVSSPNGTTAAGLKILENEKMAEIIARSINAASKRSRELGK